jgi:hypothetical protein
MSLSSPMSSSSSNIESLKILKIEKDEFGRLVDVNTGLCFNYQKQVIGIIENGNMRNLYKDEILFCKQLGIVVI